MPEVIEQCRPVYDRHGLSGVLPGVVGSLTAAEPDAPWTPARRAVVVLVDGLGLELLRRRGGHAPFLRSLAGRTVAGTAGFPTTTATSMGTFGTGATPGTHGLVGYQVRDPATDALFNELTWDDGPVPETWQPQQTWFERAAREGIAVTRIGPGFFDGSGLTRAALRGGRFVAAESLDARVEAAISAVRRDSRALVYLYWGELDKTGHLYGAASWQWGDELERIDGALRTLAERLPSDCSLTVTADHGMVDVETSDKTDIAHDSELAAGVRYVGGEMRSLQLHVVPGATQDVLDAWRSRYDEESAWILPREEALAAGWFGTMRDGVEGRIGEVIVAMAAPVGAYDSRVMNATAISLIGQHGSLTLDEQLIPVIHLPAAGGATHG